MNKEANLWEIADSKVWSYNGIVMGHSTTVYSSNDQVQHAAVDDEKVRLHMGLRGDYGFKCKQIKGAWDLLGGHHNILYTNGLDLSLIHI